MPYNGLKLPIPLGQKGLYTDSPQSRVPLGALSRAYNVTFSNEFLETDFGSMLYNSDFGSSSFPLPYAGQKIRSFFDFWPDSTTQRLHILIENGSGGSYLARFPDKSHVETIAPDPSYATAASTYLSLSPYVNMIEGGLELQGYPKKQFTYTGNSPVQVVEGDSAYRHNLELPPADWATNNYPISGIIHRSLHFAFGCAGNPHTVYASSGTDHEDFRTTPLTFQVYPGEGELLVDAIVFRGRMYIAKYPNGVYYLNDTDTDPENWYFQKLTSEFGASCPRSMVSITDDILIANSVGSITSLKAALIFGDVTTADVLHQVGARNSRDIEVNPGSNKRRTMMFYPYKKTAMTAFNSPGSSTPDKLLVLDYKNVNEPPLVSWNNKEDGPNFLGLIKDQNKVPRPAYAGSGYSVYLMDSPNRWVGDTGDGDPPIAMTYAMDAMTPYLDMGVIQPDLASMNKIFEILEIEYVATGNWDLLVDVHIDGKFRYTKNFSMRSGTSELDSFKLESSTISDEGTIRVSQKISGIGKRIALRFYSEGQAWAKLASAKIYFKPGEEQNVNLGA